MNDINELFSRIQVINGLDPTDLTPQDIDALVVFYRYRRTRKASLQTTGTNIDDVLGKPQVKISPGTVRRNLHYPDTNVAPS